MEIRKHYYHNLCYRSRYNGPCNCFDNSQSNRLYNDQSNCLYNRTCINSHTP